MTTKTDFHMILDLREKYTPKTEGIVSKGEADLIRDTLEIEQRNNIELQNVRDMVVMLYGQWFDQKRNQYNLTKDKKAFDKSREYMDAMSAITCVIDQEKIKRGMEV